MWDLQFTFAELIHQEQRPGVDVGERGGELVEVAHEGGHAEAD